jgi:D-xylose transport system substrate-binding protein
VSRRLRGALAVSAVFALAVVAAGCGSSDDNSTSSSGGGGGGGGTIALLLPENQTPRYEAADRPYFEDKVQAICPDCEILYSNATQDAAKQQSQAEAALTQGIDVMVLDPVDATAAAGIVTKAAQQDVPVISYDRLIMDAPIDYYTSFDNEEVGRLQAQTLDKKLASDGNPKGPIIMINGDPADSNAALFKKGAHSVFDSSGIDIAKEYDTPGWLGTNAQNEAQQAITALGNNGFWGVYGANDDMAGGAIAAMKSAGIDPATRPSTGQDATVAGIQRILAGQQYMTVYKAVKPEASAAAEMAVALAQGKTPDLGQIASSLGNGGKSEQLDNGQGQIPSVIFTPVAVTKDNVKSTVIADQYVKASEVCVGPYVSACKAAGISP